MGAPTGVVTFLLSDIEGSTARWEADPEAMREALALHDETTRSAIEARGGSVFKHTGDGVCAAFASPRGAIAAAVDAQRRLTLPVRIGLATGEAEQRGDDYFGPPLNRAARVMAAGHGGQILVSAETAGLLDGVELVDLGVHRLKDLVEPLRLYQVHAKGLRTEFPALRTLDLTPGNLRIPASTLIGREQELADLSAAVRSHRLVTLTGVGGVGKTRLALHVASATAAEFPEGVFVTELAAVGDPAAVPDAVAGVLGVTRQAAMTVAESVAQALDGRVRLLVLDNCEHVLDAAAELIELILSHSTTVRVLATSREALRATGEHAWPVAPLSAREGLESAGVALFMDRAQAAAPGFALHGTADTEAVVEICRRLDGIPLAIELAASRMVAMSPREVRDRLDDRLRLLAGGRRGVERHQTLRHAVQWSYDLLSGDEQTLLNRCSVFAGDFDLDAAVALAGPADEYTVLDRLDALVRKSLLYATRWGAGTRYAMLETVRAFAEEQLVASGQSVAARTAHARYFAGRHDDVLALWDGPRQGEAYEWLDTELANLRSAFRWAADEADLDTAATIAVFAAFLGNGSQRLEPMGWAEELIEAAQERDHPQLAALYVLASRCVEMGRIDEGITYCEQGLALLDQPGYADVPFGFGRHLAGAAYLYVARPGRWAELLQAEIASQDHPAAWLRASLVTALMMSGRTDEAMALDQGLVEAADEAGNPFGQMTALASHGLVLRRSDPNGALEAMRKGYLLASASGNRTAAFLVTPLARLEIDLGEHSAALDHLTVALHTFHDAGATESLRPPVAVLAALLDAIGRPAPAAILAGFAAVTPLTISGPPLLGTTLKHLREVIGDEDVEELLRQGRGMDLSAIARVAFAEIAQASSRLTESQHPLARP